MALALLDLLGLDAAQFEQADRVEQVREEQLVDDEPGRVRHLDRGLLEPLAEAVELERPRGMLFGSLQSEMMPKGERGPVHVLSRERAVDALLRGEGRPAKDGRRRDGRARQSAQPARRSAGAT